MAALRPRIAAMRRCSSAPVLALAGLVALLAVAPEPLIPLASAYRDLCERYPILARLTGHLPPLPLALLFLLAALAFLGGARVGLVGLAATVRINRRLRRQATTLPPRLATIADRLGLSTHVTYLADPALLACCYGVLRPRVAVTAGLLAALDDAELIAVLGHERHHLRRRDPVRYLLLDIVTATAFMLPLAATLRQRAEATIELAADRAALAVAPRSALAGALLAALRAPQPQLRGVAGLSTTEARIAHLAGQPLLPPISGWMLVMSLVLPLVTVMATIHLAAAADLMRLGCPLCPAMG
jgi:Zn-dependent protease with chaperone function